MSEVVKNRYDFMMLFDVENGNPNGDPDAGNMPRIDPETSIGEVTNVCLKHKIRKYVELVKEDTTGYRIYDKDHTVLNKHEEEAFIAYSVPRDKLEISKLKKKDPDLDLKLRDWMCKNFFDIRTFGAALTTFKSYNINYGQVKGPVQINFAKSVEPVFPQRITITRVAVSKEEDAEKENTMGSMYIIPYGLYRCEGHIDAPWARKTTGFTEDDLNLLWDAIYNMFEHDHSATRGKMVVRKLIIFKHDSELGNAPSHKLFDLVKVQRIDPDSGVPARAFSDYEVTIDQDHLPNGVSVTVRD